MSLFKEYVHILQQYGVDAESEDVTQLKKMLVDQGAYLPVFCWFYVSGIPLLELQQLYYKIKTYRELLRQYKITPLDVYKPKLYDARQQYELLIDVVDGAISENQKETFARSFISKKYLHLVNRKSMDVLWKLHDEQKLDRKKIQNLIFDKLAYYKYDTEFEKSIIKTYDTLTKGTWNSELIKLELMQDAIDVTFCDDKVVIAKIDSFEQCKKFGSRNWCISRSSSMFDHYGKYGTQYIVWNTAKNRVDRDAMVGYTARPVRENHNTLFGCSFDQFDRPYDWKIKLAKYLKYMPCVSKFEYDEVNIETKVDKSLREVLDDETVEKFNADALSKRDLRNLASYQKNAIMYGSIFVKKMNNVSTLLEDKEINVNSNSLTNVRVRPVNMLSAAMSVKNYDLMVKLSKHKSFTDVTLTSTYYEFLSYMRPDQKTLKVLQGLCDSDRMQRKMLEHICRHEVRGISDVNESVLQKFLKNHHVSQSLVNDFLNDFKSSYLYNSVVSNLHRVGYGKSHQPFYGKRKMF